MAPYGVEEIGSFRGRIWNVRVHTCLNRLFPLKRRDAIHTTLFVFH
jgi:hypothetical protein